MEGLSFSFALVMENIRKDLEAETFVMFFPGKRCLIYTVAIPVVSRVFSDHRNFLKADPRSGQLAYVNGVRVFGHKGILTEPGTEVWYHKRKMMDPAFQKKFLRCLMEDMTKSANKLCFYLEKNKSQNSLDIYSIMNRVALEIVCTCGFSLRDDFIMSETSDLNKATKDIFEILPLSFSSRGRYTFMLPWKFREEKNSLKGACDLLRGTMRVLLAERMDNNAESGNVSNDILDHIIRGKFAVDSCAMFISFIKILIHLPFSDN
jgi:cholesterol 24(S)-hydroxylase